MSDGSRATPLAQRRSQLIARAAEQRETLAGAAEPWRAPVAMLDRGIAVVRFFKQYPAILAAGAAVALVLNPGRAWRWGRRAYIAWQAWRAFVRPDAGTR